MLLNTQQLIEKLSGANKSFIQRVSKRQEEKYGNKDVFWATLDFINNYIEIGFGENWLNFYFDSNNGKIICTTGIYQGGKYHKNLEKCAIELYDNYRI